MSWWQWILGWLKKPPGRVTNVRIKVSRMARTITVTWDLPLVREDNKPLPKAEIANTEVLLASAAANGTVGAFASLAKIAPDATQTIERDVPDGNYRIRFIVTDIFGKVGKPVDANATVVSAPPGVVTNIKVTVA
jgi:hypothetical protein